MQVEVFAEENSACLLKDIFVELLNWTAFILSGDRLKRRCANRQAVAGPWDLAPISRGRRKVPQVSVN